MSTVSGEEQPRFGDRVREYVDNHRLMTYFVSVEALFVFAAWYLDTWMSITLTPTGPDISDIMAGLFAGWAVVFGLIGVIGLALLAGSRLLLRIG